MLPDIASYILKTAATMYLDKIRQKEEQPNVSFAFVNGSYKIDRYWDHENVLLKLKILLKNNGKSPTSVTDIVATLKYREEFLQDLGIRDPIIRSKRLNNPFLWTLVKGLLNNMNLILSLKTYILNI